MRSLFRLIGGAGLISLLAGWSATAQGQMFNCTGGFANNVQVITLGVQTTTSTTPVNIPGAIFRFTPAARCLSVEVSGQVKAPSPGAMRLQLSVTPEGEINSGPFPATRDVYTESTAFDGRSATFFVDLFEGRKTVRVQFMSVDGSPVSLSKGVITIHYSPQV